MGWPRSNCRFFLYKLNTFFLIQRTKFNFLTNSGRFSLTAAFNFFSWRQQASELTVWFLGSRSKNTTLFQSYQTYTIMIDQFWPFFFDRWVQFVHLTTVDIRINRLVPLKQLKQYHTFPILPNLHLYEWPILAVFLWPLRSICSADDSRHTN